MQPTCRRVRATRKRDATVGSMIALLRYGTGMPFSRDETLQEELGIPLPASTQWDIVADQAERAEPAFEEMARQAAQADVVYNDDTTVKILAEMDRQAWPRTWWTGRVQTPSTEVGHRRGKIPPKWPETRREAGRCPRRRSPKPNGRACSLRASWRRRRGGEKIALFLSGHQHAGENLKDVLARRAADLPPPIQMCDALSRNLPKGLKTILANCLAHGRRKFVDVAEDFPEECRHVLESLAVVYRNDAIAKERNLSPAERLIFHQAQSGPVMEELHAWLRRQFEERSVEPNSALGSSIHYMLRHWEALTLFLRVAGCAAGQQRLRTGVEDGDPASQELLVLQDPSRRPRGRHLYEPDPHLPTLRSESLRLPHGTGAAREGSGREARGLDALELSADPRRSHGRSPCRP